MLDLHNIYKTFNAGTVNEKTALNGLNLHLNEAILSPSSAETEPKIHNVKRCCGNMVCGRGTIKIDDVDVTKLPEHKRAKYLGRVFQDPMTGTAATMQIEENMAWRREEE